MRLKTLNGAPLPQNLDFSSANLLDTSNCHEFDIIQQHAPNQSTLTPSKWRSLAPNKTYLHTGWSQPYLPRSRKLDGNVDISITLPETEQSTIFTTESTKQLDLTCSFQDQPSVADDFLEESLYFHNSLLSSQIAQDVDQTISSSSFLTTSFGTTTSEISNTNEISECETILKLPTKITITTLSSLYSAKDLQSIYPNTPTSNLLCALTSIPEWRQVTVRKSGRKTDLCEIVIADDTQSGFRITFWLRPQQESNKKYLNKQDSLNKTLEKLQVGDILLLRNIALTSFRDTVYGQSLHHTINRAKTTVNILMKSNGMSIGPLSGLPTSIAEPFTRVKRWTRAHIATKGVDSRKRRGHTSPQIKPLKRKVTHSTPNDTLPPDTLEAV